MTSPRYFQVGGFRGHITPSGHGEYGGEGTLAERLAGPKSPLRPVGVTQGPVELVLGIQPSGASALLMTEGEAFDYGRMYRAHPRSDGFSSNNFVSLSPIQFEGAEDLKKKLTSYRQTKKNKGGAPRDMSQANSGYYHGNLEGTERGEYELNRLLYRLTMGDLNRKKYSLPQDLALPQGTRVCVLTFTALHGMLDTRTDSERTKDPKILDVGFAEADPQSFELKKDTIRHFVAQENRLFKNKIDRTDLPDVDPETLTLEDIGVHMTQLLNEGTGPTLLIVYDKEATDGVLRRLGCEPPRALKLRDVFLPLVRGPQRYSNNDRGYHDSRRDPPRYDRNHSRRSRSRSPARSTDPRRPGDPRARPSSPTRASRDDPRSEPGRKFVYADVHTLYHKMSSINPTFGMRPLDIADSLGVYRRSSPFDWGASFDTGILLKCWKAMASGLTIDEQRAILPTLSAALSTHPLGGPSAEDDYDDYDEDRDPNEDLPDIIAGQARKDAIQMFRPVDYFSDDEDEY